MRAEDNVSINLDSCSLKVLTDLIVGNTRVRILDLLVVILAVQNEAVRWTWNPGFRNKWTSCATGAHGGADAALAAHAN
jgi:hypothetical protein